jgi:hypothetical protein
METKAFPEMVGTAASPKPSWWRKLLTRLTARKQAQSLNQQATTAGQVGTADRSVEFGRR